MAIPSLRSALYRVTTAFWATVLRLGAARGYFLSREMHPWEGGAALVVAPHPDDECIGAGGATLLHRDQGDPVTVVAVTDGSASRAVAGPPRARAAVRRREMAAACEALDVSLTWLGLLEGQWEPEAARAGLAPLIADADILYLPSIVDFHPEHLAVARLAAGLLHPHQSVRVYELGVPLSPTLTTMLADTTAVHERAAAALGRHASQRRAWQPLARRNAYRKALYGAAGVEPFWALNGAAYQRMVAAGEWTGHTSPFRGLRPRPFSDGWSYLLGERARRHLWHAAAGPHA